MTEPKSRSNRTSYNGVTCARAHAYPGSTRVPQVQQVSKIIGSTVPHLSGAKLVAGSLLPRGSKQKERHGNASETSMAPKRAPAKAAAERRRRHHPSVFPATDCRWTREMEQFEEARAREAEYSMPRPTPTPMVAATYWASPSPTSIAYSAATGTVVGGGGQIGGREKPRRLWEWSAKDCAVVAAAAISSFSGSTGPLPVGAGVEDVSMLVGTEGRSILSESEEIAGDDDGGCDDSDCTTDRQEGGGEEEEQEQQQESNSSRKMSSSSSAKSSSARKKCRNERARVSLNTADAAATIVRTAATVVPHHAARPKGDGVAPSAGTGHRTRTPPAAAEEGRQGQGKIPRKRGRPRKARPAAVGGDRDAARCPAVMPFASPTAAYAAAEIEDERRAKELSAALNRNSPRGTRAATRAAVQPGSIRQVSSSSSRAAFASTASRQRKAPNRRSAARGSSPSAPRHRRGWGGGGADGTETLVSPRSINTVVVNDKSRKGSMRSRSALLSGIAPLAPPVDSAATAVAASRGRRPASARRSGSSNDNSRPASQPSSGQMNRKQNFPPFPNTASSAAAAAAVEAPSCEAKEGAMVGVNSTAAEGDGGGDNQSDCHPWADSGLYFGLGTTAEVLWEDGRWYRCSISRISAEGRRGSFEFLPYKRGSKGPRQYSEELDFEDWIRQGRVTLPETNLKWD